MSNKRDYNGLRSGPAPFGGQVHTLARQLSPEEVQANLNQQHQALAREIFVRSASKLISGADMDGDCACPLDEEFETISYWSQKAAVGYFKGLQYHLEKQQRLEGQSDPNAPDPTASVSTAPTTNEA